MMATSVREQFIRERFLAEFFRATTLQTGFFFRGGERKATWLILNEKRQRP
jgi:hypothetical protein